MPIIPATVIGSWSLPGWYVKFCADVAQHPSQYGPDDREESLHDAVRLAIDDQLRAGADIITDGEMQRVDFNLGFYDYLEGLQPLPTTRIWGPPAHDQRNKYTCIAPLKAPRGLGLVAEYRRLRQYTSLPAKMPIPGPFTLAGCIQGGDVYKNRDEITAALLPIVNHEMKQLVQAGVDFIQLDEPSFACHPSLLPSPSGRGAGGEGAERFLDLIARTVAGVDAKISMHMCFGNYRGRAVGWRSYAPLFPHLASAKVHQLALEFASREMAEIELVKQIPAPMELAVGLVDVKNTWIEPPELVAQRLRETLKYIEPERVHVTPDCGFSQTARSIAQQKLANMVEGVRIVRRELKNGEAQG
ncbi:MAG: methionine synthase [Gemmataceae bacterium]|nr:methionine synthase [Gemmataceae bacterium]